MELGLEGKVVVVTGAGRGIGLATAQAFAGEGARVVAGSRSVTPELEALAAEHGVVAVRVDLSTAEGPGELIATAVATFGRVDVLVNNLGRSVSRTCFVGISDAEWEETFALNFFSALRACRAALPSMLEQGAGSIVNVSSVNGFLPVPRLVDYSAAKAALKSLSKSLSEEYGPRGIRVNTVSPGPTSTPLWLDPDTGMAARMAAATDSSATAVLSNITSLLTLGRFSEPHEVAALILFVSSDVAGTITGADLVIDSGRVKTM